VDGRVRGGRTTRKWTWLAALVCATSILTIVSGALGSGDQRQGGILRIAIADLDYVDPALAYTFGSWAILDTTCARLMTYPDKPMPEGLRLVPEVAVDFPKISRNGKTYTFALRRGFRFSDGTPVRASAFARAINRTLAPGVESGGQAYTADIVGAADVLSGKAEAATGVTARGNTLVVRFTRPVADFAAMTTMPFLCAVPPTLPSEPEGLRTFDSAGPYVVTEYRPGERVTIRRNRFYRGTRPHHVDGFDVDLRIASASDALDQVEAGTADWASAISPNYFEPGRGLAAKFGVNRSRFFVRPGLVLRHIVFNNARPLFRDNVRLRQAVSFALNRRELARAATTSPLAYRLTDQYLPPSLPGFRDAKLYPLERPNLPRARVLARGELRGGKAAFYVSNTPQPLAVAQTAKRQLAEIGLEVELRPLTAGALGRALLTPGEPWDLTVSLWAPDYADPFQYVNLLFDPQYANGGNIGRFDSPAYTARMRRAGRLQGPERYRAYGDLDVDLARDALPSAPISFFNEPTLVSDRVGCIVLRPTLDLTAACLR
jgi:ABC-type oligopeptide transport system substrate-binding subunit